MGAGTGANLPHYRSPRSLLLVEPDPAMARRLRRRLAATQVGARVHEGTLESLELADASVDAVVCTLVLCTVPDPGALLAEGHRVLRPGGELVLVEHVRHRGWVGACMQTLLTPLQRMVAGGCHLNRATATTVAAAGFDIAGLDPLDLFRPMGAGIAGVARPLPRAVPPPAS